MPALTALISNSWWHSRTSRKNRFKITFLMGMMVAAIVPLDAQQPFYTDDPGVTDTGALHLEIFNEFDVLQSKLYPDLRQNTTNYRINIGLPLNLEFDVDNPTLLILRTGSTVRPPRSVGQGDLNTGIKWNFRKTEKPSRSIAMALSMYIEFPIGNSAAELGSGFVDYWLNTILQKRLTERTTLTTNAGILFAGNTTTGVIGIQARGVVFTGGVSVIHQVTERLRFGIEVYGGIPGKVELSKSQMQFLGGGSYQLKPGVSIDFALLGGKYVASPRVGAQLGIAVDLPSLARIARKLEI
jgi:hypothetical protein